MHSHSFAGRTSFNDGHTHDYQGVTSSVKDFPGHTHIMSGETSLDDGHTHLYRSSTGPAIYVGDKHYHMYSGVTLVADRHTHDYRGATSFYNGMS